jgi:2-oxoglutarate ferredoxin oxidoreductase subunit alpha
MSDEGVAHLRESVRLHRDFEFVERNRSIESPPFGTDAPDGVPPMPAFGDGANLLVTGSTHDEWGYRRVDHPEQHARLIDRINRKVLDHTDDIVEVDARFLDDAEAVVVAYGFTGRSALAAVKQLRASGIKAGLLRLKTLWPFAEREVRALDGKAIVVPEMNRGQVAGLVRQQVCGGVVPLCQTNGEVIEPAAIVDKVKEALS